MVKREQESASGAPANIFPYSDYTNDDYADQLGTLPPGTLVLAEYPNFPYFPAYVMSRAEARQQRQEPLVSHVSDLEKGEITGCGVRFFASNGCAVLSATKVEPLVVNDNKYMDWIWESSQAQQRKKKVPEFDKQMHNLWASAFDHARAYALKNARVIPEWVLEEQGLKQGRTYRQVGFLKPGTFVWTSLQSHPIWPSYVEKETGKPKVPKGKLTSVDAETEPLIFIGDDVERPPMYTSTENMMAFTADVCWIEHMRVRSLISRGERGWRKVTKKDWNLWENACEEAFTLAGALEPPVKSE